MKPFDWLAFTAYTVAALAHLGGFLIGGDLDNLMIAALFVGIGIWHYNSICAGRIIDDYAALTGQLRGELAKQTALARHEVKWADLPRISSRPIPVPEGHPEHDGGAA